MDCAKHCIVEPGSKLRLKHRDPHDTFGEERNDRAHEKTLTRLRELQHLLYADQRYSLLIVLQGLDAAGKDGTIRHVMSGVNPQGCDVTSFKAPSSEELARDYLWRVHKAVAPRGSIGIFNRSQRCSTKWAPWYVIPANRKWVRNYLVADLVVRALDDMRLKYPAPTVDISQVVLK
jgi:polyphosphate kinase 2 (PPK2 family)